MSAWAADASPGKLDDFFCIPLKIPYCGVDLGESDLHFFSLST